jgi:SPP1 family predicted phage head-tail adaptor
VAIQAPNPGSDGGGGRGDPWASPTAVATLRARIEPLKGGEKLRAMQLQDSVSHRITIRHRADVTARMRVVFGARVFNIRAVIDPGERRRWLELLCEEGVAT